MQTQRPGSGSDSRQPVEDLEIGGAVHLGHDEHGAIGTGTEPLGEKVIGLPSRRVLGHVALVGETEAEIERRRRQNEEKGRSPDGERPGAVLDRSAKSVPQGLPQRFLGARVASDRRRGLRRARIEPRTKTTKAAGKPTSNRRNPNPAPKSAMATRPAIAMPRHRVTSMRSPSSDSTAGSSVIELMTTMATVTEAAKPTPAMNFTPINASPSNEMTTVMPAKTTERPAVSSATTAADSASCPWSRDSRYRVTMNSA